MIIQDLCRSNWLVLNIIILLCSSCITFSLDTQFFIIPEANGSCWESQCYTIQNVISNQPFFLASNTYIELLPGRHTITERHGQLIIKNIKNFTLQGSKLGNVSIWCHPNATFGLTIVNSVNITVSHLYIRYCAAHREKHNVFQYTLHVPGSQKPHPTDEYLHCWLNQCSATAHHLPLEATLITQQNKGIISINDINITHSTGIGILAIENAQVIVSNSLFAYNQFNCIFYHNGGKLNLLKNYVISGGPSNINLSSGINIIGHHITSNIKVNVSGLHLQNNQGIYGNFYLKVYYYDVPDIDIVIQNTALMQDLTMSPIGIIIDYKEGLPYYQLLRDSSCHMERLDILSNRISIWSTKKNWIAEKLIVLKDSILTKTCIIIRDIDPLSGNLDIMNVELSNVMLRGSQCPYAITANNTKHLSIGNLTIAESFDNMFYTNNSRIRFVITLTFCHNNGSFLIHSGYIEFVCKTWISNNSASYLESIFLSYHSIIEFWGSNTNFVSNKGKQGGAILASNSLIHIRNANVYFIGNSADTGGAISLIDGAIITVNSYTENELLFAKNHASTYGGGIFVEENRLWIEGTSLLKCFAESTSDVNGKFLFENNTAGVAGASLFGGWIDTCKQDKFSPIYKFFNNNETLTLVSSNPSRVCLCSDGIPVLYKSKFQFEIFPGQTIEVQAVAVGQRFGVVPAVVKAETLYRDFEVFDELQTLQDVGSHCTTLKYTIRSPNSLETINLLIERRCTPGGVPQPSQQNQHPDILVQLTIIVSLKNCSLGFTFDPKQNSCVCHPLLQKQGVECDITQQRVIKKPHQWIGVTPNNGFIVHQHCPFDYCVAKSVALNLSTPDEQCAFNRSGTLCGACQLGLSQVLGTSNCKKCSNLWLLLILPFTLVGIALVMCLIMLNLTVAAGTVNGLIFYANVVRINASVFFPGHSAHTFLGWFIAWLNLDLGIETCFYNGLNSYAKIWLESMFPLFVLTIVIATGFAGHYFSVGGRIFGNNIIQVLATLLLASYTKCMKMVVVILQMANVSDFTVTGMVWYYDGNINYLEVKHIPLFLLALILTTLLLLPFTLMTLSVQMLKRASHYRPFGLIAKFLPLIEAYSCPYKDQHRYWSGILLMMRIIMTLCSSFGDLAINLLVIIVSITILFVHLAYVGGVYKVWPLSLLEYSFFFNLVALSVGTFYTLHSESQITVTQVSVIISFITTVLIIIYHSYLKIQLKCQDTSLTNFLKRKIVHQDENDYTQEIQLHPQVTYSVVELHEPFIKTS